MDAGRRQLQVESGDSEQWTGDVGPTVDPIKVYFTVSEPQYSGGGSGLRREQPAGRDKNCGHGDFGGRFGYPHTGSFILRPGK